MTLSPRQRRCPPGAGPAASGRADDLAAPGVMRGNDAVAAGEDAPRGERHQRFQLLLRGRLRSVEPQRAILRPDVDTIQREHMEVNVQIHRSRQFPLRARRSSAVSWMPADATFSSRCFTDEVPGIGSIAGDRARSHAVAI